MKKIFYPILFLSFAFCSLETKAQVINGGILAADWTFYDMNGNSHNLYSYLNQGKSVVIDISTTWCYGCWVYHETHNLKNFYNQYGPNGTNQAMVFLIEPDDKTGISCMYGQTSGCATAGGHTPGTYGNWLAGTPYPVINIPTASEANSFKSNYSIGVYPTLMLICAGDKMGRTLGQATTAQIYNAMMQCPTATSVNEVDLSTSVSVFPNPSSGEVFVGIQAMDLGPVSIRAYNVLGKVVLEMNQNFSASAEFKLDMTEQPNGIYLVEVKSGDASTFKKVVLNK